MKYLETMVGFTSHIARISELWRHGSFFPDVHLEEEILGRIISAIFQSWLKEEVFHHSVPWLEVKIRVSCDIKVPNLWQYGP